VLAAVVQAGSIQEQNQGDTDTDRDGGRTGEEDDRRPDRPGAAQQIAMARSTGG
jgi:hypothetical protein